MDRQLRWSCSNYAATFILTWVINMTFDPLLLALVFIVWMIIAFLLGRLTKRENRQALTALELELAQEKHAHDVYRKEVAQHFSETAKLFNSMTESYRNVYDHLSKSASSLCKQEGEVQKLDPMTKKLSEGNRVDGQSELHAEAIEQEEKNNDTVAR